MLYILRSIYELKNVIYLKNKKKISENEENWGRRRVREVEKKRGKRKRMKGGHTL